MALSLQRSKFKPSAVVMVSDPNFSRKSLSKRAKLVVEEESLDVRRNHLLSLEREGYMFRISSPDVAEVWGRSLMQLPDDVRKFALNSAVDRLPHNANLHTLEEEGGRHLLSLW